MAGVLRQYSAYRTGIATEKDTVQGVNYMKKNSHVKHILLRMYECGL